MVKRVVAEAARTVRTRRAQDALKCVNDFQRSKAVETATGREQSGHVPPEAFGLYTGVQSTFLTNLQPGQVPRYITDLGEAWVGDSRRLLKKIEDESIDLVITSPPYGLVKKRNMVTRAKMITSGGFGLLRKRFIGF